jgi:hypothetical protein
MRPNPRLPTPPEPFEAGWSELTKNDKNTKTVKDDKIMLTIFYWPGKKAKT